MTLYCKAFYRSLWKCQLFLFHKKTANNTVFIDLFKHDLEKFWLTINYGSSLLIYLSKELHMHFGNSVDCFWPLNSQIRSWIWWGFGTKCSNCTWAKQAQVIPATQFKNIMNTFNVDLQGLWHILFSHST